MGMKTEDGETQLRLLLDDLMEECREYGNEQYSEMWNNPPSKHLMHESRARFAALLLHKTGIDVTVTEGKIGNESDTPAMNGGACPSLVRLRKKRRVRAEHKAV